MRLALAALFVACPLAGQITQPAAATGPLFSQTNRVTVASGGAQTITGTGAGTVTLAANFFGAAGNTLRFFINGFLSTAAAPGGLNFAVFLGATSICSGTVPVTGSDTNGSFTVDGYIAGITTGSSGTVACGGRADVEQQVSPFSLSVGLGTFASPVTINTTITQAFDLKVQWNSFASGDTITSVVYVLTGS